MAVFKRMMAIKNRLDQACTAANAKAMSRVKPVKKRADIIPYNLARGARDGLRSGILQARLFLGKHLLF